MSDDRDLGQPRMPFSDFDTSRDAAMSVNLERAREQRARVYSLVEDAEEEGIGGLTTHEVIARFRSVYGQVMLWSATTARIWDLVQDGRMKRTDLRLPSPSGRACIVWATDDSEPLPRKARRMGPLAAVIAKEREACAKLCEDHGPFKTHAGPCCGAILAAAIRACGAGTSPHKDMP